MQLDRRWLPFSTATGVLLGLWILGAGTALLIFSRNAIFIFLNQDKGEIFDAVITVFTAMGDGLFVIALAMLFLLFKQKQLAFMLVLSFLVSGLFVQIFKHLIELPRPVGVITPVSSIHHPGWSTLHTSFSFPSGHTTSAFAAATMLAYYLPKWSITVFAMAIVTGLSRVCLGQHFLLDVWVGSLLGILVSVALLMAEQRFHFLDGKRRRQS